jgi:hypothetical protein
MNARSIFSSCTGNSRRYASDEYPVPKSSIDNCTPSFRRLVSAATAWSGSLISTDSVSSRVTALDGSPATASARITLSANRGCTSWCPETLTLRVRSGKSRRQAAT